MTAQLKLRPFKTSQKSFYRLESAMSGSGSSQGGATPMLRKKDSIGFGGAVSAAGFDAGAATDAAEVLSSSLVGSE